MAWAKRVEGVSENEKRKKLKTIATGEKGLLFRK